MSRKTAEYWVPSSSWPDYEVSNFGRVRSITRDHTTTTSRGTKYIRRLKGRIIRLQKQRSGYLRVCLCPGRRPVFVSRLVCEAFHGPPPSSRYEADHINHNRLDNRPENLRWVTTAENIAHRIHACGTKHGRVKLTEDSVLEIRHLTRHAGTTLDKVLAAQFNVTPQTISYIRRRIKWKHLKEKENAQ